MVMLYTFKRVKITILWDLSYMMERLLLRYKLQHWIA